jgi:hypothetical protein
VILAVVKLCGFKERLSEWRATVLPRNYIHPLSKSLFTTFAMENNDQDKSGEEVKSTVDDEQENKKESVQGDNDNTDELSLHDEDQREEEDYRVDLTAEDEGDSSVEVDKFTFGTGDGIVVPMLGKCHFISEVVERGVTMNMYGTRTNYEKILEDKFTVIAAVISAVKLIFGKVCVVILFVMNA